MRFKLKLIKMVAILAGFGDEYFNNSENREVVDKPFLHKYKSVLTSKSAEETMVIKDPIYNNFFITKKERNKEKCP